MKFSLNFNHFEKKYDPHRFCIFDVTDSENVVRKMSKKSHIRGCFDKQYGKRSQILFKSVSQHLYSIHWSLAMKLCSKKSLLLICLILGPLVNTLAADENYPLHNREYLTIPIQMQLSQKQKTFSEFFAAFLKFSLNFKHFKKKEHPYRFCIFKVTDHENIVR